MLLASQKQCYISKPVPYDTRVSSSHAWSIVSLTRSCSALLSPGVLVCPGAGDAGVHNRRRSLARQWGRRDEGIGVRCCGYGAGPLTDGVVTEGMVSCRGLASGTLLSLVARGSTPRSLDPRTRTRRPIAILLASSLGLYVDEEGPDLVRDDDGVEKEGAGGVTSSRGTVRRVFCTRDISRVKRSTAILRELEDATEDCVGGFVGAAALPPPLDDPSIVAVEQDAVALV